MPKINDKFSVPPVSENDAHVDLMDSNLSEIFSFEFERSLSNDFVIRFKNRLFQIDKENRFLPRPKAKILLRLRLDGSISLYHNGQELRFTEIFIQNRKEEIRHLCYA